MKKSDPAIFREAIFKIHDAFRDSTAKLKDVPSVDITVRENQTLTLVCNLTEEKPEGITLKQLAAAMKLAPATVSELIESLVNKGLLQRIQNPEDRRAVQITLTGKGQKLHDEFLKSVDDLCEKLLAKLFPSESSALLEGLKSISKQLDKV